MIVRYYSLPGNGNGGALHIITEDENLAAHHIRWCRRHAAEHAAEWGSASPVDAVLIAERLLDMTLAQRRECIDRLQDWLIQEGR